MMLIFRSCRSRQPHQKYLQKIIHIIWTSNIPTTVPFMKSVFLTKQCWVLQGISVNQLCVGTEYKHRPHVLSSPKTCWLMPPPLASQPIRAVISGCWCGELWIGWIVTSIVTNYIFTMYWTFQVWVMKRFERKVSWGTYKVQQTWQSLYTWNNPKGKCQYHKDVSFTLHKINIKLWSVLRKASAELNLQHKGLVLYCRYWIKLDAHNLITNHCIIVL